MLFIFKKFVFYYHNLIHPNIVDILLYFQDESAMDNVISKEAMVLAKTIEKMGFNAEPQISCK